MATTDARSKFFKDPKFWGAILAVLGAGVATVQTGEATWTGAIVAMVAGIIGTVLTLFTKSPSAPDANIEPPSGVVAVPTAEQPRSDVPPSDLPPPFVPGM